MLVRELLFAVFLPQYGVNALRVFVKRNFLGVGKSYTIKGKQAEKKAENALCGRLKCVLVTGSIKNPAHLGKEAAAGVNTPYSHAFLRCKGCFCSLFEVGGAGREAPQKPTVNAAQVQTVLPLK